MTSETRLVRKPTTDISDYVLDKVVRVLPLLGTALFGYNAYLQVIKNDNPLESSFSVAVFATFLVSVASISYAHSLPEGSEKEKARTMTVVAGLLVSIAVTFLFRAWMVLPPQVRWVVFLASLLPATAAVAFLSIHRRLVASSSSSSSLPYPQ